MSSLTVHVIRGSGMPIKIGRRTVDIYILVTSGDQKQNTRTISGKAAPEWNAQLGFTKIEHSHLVVIKIMNRRTVILGGDEVLGQTSKTVEKLVAQQGKEKDLTVDFGAPSPDRKARMRLIIALKAQSLPVRQNSYHESLALAPSVSLPSYSGSTWSSLVAIVEKLNGLVRVIDEMARIHPYVNVAWLFLSLAYHSVENQKTRDHNVQRLGESMYRMYSFVEHSNVETKIPPMGDVVQLMAQETVECLKFIQQYNHQSIARRIATSAVMNVDQRIREFDEHFQQLRRDFDTGLTVQSYLLIQRTADDSSERTFIRSHLKHVLASWDPDRGCLPGTRKSAIEEIMKWVINHEDKYPENVFWLSGVAGSGKTSIAHTVAELSAKMGLLGSSFFFKHDEAGRNESTSVFSTMAIDLAAFDSRLADQIANILQTTPSLTGPRRQFQSLILGPIQACGYSSPVLLLFDALDDCGTPRDHQEFLQMLAQESKRLPKNVKILITSRRDEDIVDAFRNFPIHHSDLDLHSVENRSDLINYAETKFADIARSKSGKPNITSQWPGAQARAEFVERTAGLFIWASTALETLRESWNPDKDLQDLLSESSAGKGAQETLDALYLRTLEKNGLWDDDGFVKAFRVSVGVVIVSRETLLMDSIDRLIGEDLGDHRVEHVFSRLGSVVRTSDGPVRFLHPSFSDFLIDPSRCQNPNMVVVAREHHYAMVSRCIKLMQSSLKRNIIECPDPSLLNAEIAELPRLIKQSMSEELQYACRHWIYHLVKGEGDQQAQIRLVYDFLSSQAIEWIEALSFLKSMSVLMSGLGEVGEWAKNHTHGKGKLPNLIVQLRHFCHAFASILSGAANHIYTSALPFVPAGSSLDPLLSKWTNLPKMKVGREPLWPSFAVLRRDTGRVHSIAYSPNRPQLASASDKTIWILNTHTQLPLNPALGGHTDQCSCLAYSFDGKFIISGSWDRSIRIWSSQTGEQKAVFADAHRAPICAIACDPHGQFFVSAAQDGSVYSWTLKGRWRQYVSSMTHTITCLNISRDGQNIFCGTRGGQVICWDVSHDSSPRYVSLVSQLPVRSLVSCPNGKSIGITTGDERNASRGTLEFLDPKNGVRIGPPLISGLSMYDLDFSPDGSKVVASCQSTVRIWDIKTGKLLSCLLSPCVFVKWSSDNQFIASATSTGQTLLWNLSTIMGQVFDPNAERPARAEQLAFSYDELAIAGGTRRGTVRLWDLSTSSERPPIRPSTSQQPVTCVAFEPDGTILSCGFKDGIVQVVIIKTSRSIFTQKVHQTRINALCFSSAGPFLASSAMDGNIQIWNYRTRETIHLVDYSSAFEPARSQASHPNTISFSNQGDSLAAAFDDRVIIWSLSPTLFKCFEFKLPEPNIHMSFSTGDKGIWSSSFRAASAYHSISPPTTITTKDSASESRPILYHIDKTGWVWQHPGKRLFQVPHESADFFIFSISGKLAYQANNLLRVIDFSSALVA
ncbi:WD40 repeat-like protein [Sistotremastrum niveocremeum HHB9708]|uniref:WD40 repeat-like protein n=2 Tax=Sistotremastraceae TaxID=3402574 RepID=A0A164Q1C0_9AGAM|nr:WD40 repeat-like protein [Sistotremastrum niveocremeum HHB9708]KZT35833.1 WD40 repeat-like protein [Sistotremastrum suecicum HHB10207 ss-3]